MATNEDSEYIRLHITPLNPSLLTAILPPSILPNARNISYHNIQTFPERAYGYVELPTMDADKIKKKLNGSILKGTKVRIETARPLTETVVEEPKASKPKKEKGKKRKRDEIPAVDIGERQVKRGWTVPSAKVGKDKEKKVVVKSKYTTGPECLFKTVLPPNIAANASAKDTKPNKRKDKKGKEAVVHEFSKSTKYATFLRSSSAAGNKKGVAEFVEGRGWIDEDGNVVEVVKQVSKSKSKKTEMKPVEAPMKAMGISEQSSSDDSSSDEEPTKAEEVMEAEKEVLQDPIGANGDISYTSEDDSDGEANSSQDIAQDVKEGSISSTSESSPSEDESEDEEVDIETPKAAKEASPTSSSGSSSESDSSSDTSDSGDEPPAKKSSRPQSASGPPPGLSIKIPSTGSTPIATAVHPLEALYKRAKPDTLNPTLKPATSFSFFGADADEDMEEDSQLQVPLTPFTQRDFEYRGLRSAAPTPDTAHANKKFVWPTDNDDEDEEDEVEPSSPTRKDSSVKQKEGGKDEGANESEFQKWFYEHRGETNRAWKKRRKVVAKEKRQRENRKRQERF